MFKMIAAVCTFLALLAAPTLQQNQDPPASPCPNVFMYEPSGSEPGKWYGVAHLSTDITLHGLWLNIVLEGKADILGNWIGDVSTKNNFDFKIENAKMRISPGQVVAVRFFIQYNSSKKTPWLHAIRLNGKEICNLKSTHQAVVQTPSQPLNTLDIKPVRVQPSESAAPVLSKPVNSTSGSITAAASEIVYQTLEKPKTNGLHITTLNREHKLPDYDDDEYERAEESDYFAGGQHAIVLPSTIIDSDNTKTSEVKCGTVAVKPKMLSNGSASLEGQWPWHVSINDQGVNSCGGTLVSHRHVITAAHCVTESGNTNLLANNAITIYLGTHDLNSFADGAQIGFVEKITVHPKYNGVKFNDIAIIELQDPVTYTDYVRPACLWPEDETHLKNIIGKNGALVSWGYDVTDEDGNVNTNLKRDEQCSRELPVVSIDTCIRSNIQFFSQYTTYNNYCAGNRDGKDCSRDSGGGMVFKKNGIWYFRGILSTCLSEDDYHCNTSHYYIFSDVAKYLPWIRENVSDF